MILFLGHKFFELLGIYLFWLINVEMPILDQEKVGSRLLQGFEGQTKLFVLKAVDASNPRGSFDL